MMMMKMMTMMTMMMMVVVMMVIMLMMMMTKMKKMMRCLMLTIDSECKQTASTILLLGLAKGAVATQTPRGASR